MTVVVVVQLALGEIEDAVKQGLFSRGKLRGRYAESASKFCQRISEAPRFFCMLNKRVFAIAIITSIFVTHVAIAADPHLAHRKVIAAMHERLASQQDQSSSSKILDPQGNFVLFITNQSFAISPVDITVVVDGEKVLTFEFHCRGQHKWYPFGLDLAPGKHTIELRSKRGGAKLEKEFEVTNQKYGVVCYWFYPEAIGGAPATPRELKFDVYDSRPGFE